MITPIYEMAVKIVGEVPQSSFWIYDLVTCGLLCSLFGIFIIPISLMFKGIIGK